MPIAISGVSLLPPAPPADLVDIRDFSGYDPTGNNTQDSTVFAWLTQTMGSGKQAYAPPGIYSIDTGISVSMTGDMEVSLPRGALFKSTANLPKAMIELKDNGGTHRFGLTWRGGAFDNALGVFVVASDSNSGISFTRLKRVLVDGSVFTGAATYTQASTTTDTAISAVDCVDMTITNCFFSGQGDTALYFGGNSDNSTSSDDGGDIVITNNHFEQCYQAFAYKRQGARAIFAHNTLRDMYSGVSTLEASGAPSGNAAPGRQVLIAYNTAKRIETSFARLDSQARNSIVGNRILDFGYLPDGVTESATPQAIRILGSSQCRVTGNIIALEDWAQGGNGSADHVGIYFAGYQYTGTSGTVTDLPDQLVYDGNDFININTAVQENNTLGTTGPTYGLGNTYVNVTRRLNAVNAGSFTRFSDPGTASERTMFGSTNILQVGSAGTFSTRFRTFLDVVGWTRITKVSQTLSFGTVAAGASVNVNVTLTGATPTTDTAWLNPGASAQAPNGIVYQCRVLTDAVEVRATNVTGSSITIPDGTFLVNLGRVS